MAAVNILYCHNICFLIVSTFYMLELFKSYCEFLYGSLLFLCLCMYVLCGLMGSDEPNIYVTYSLSRRKITNRKHNLLCFVGAVPQGTATRLTTAAVIYFFHFSSFLHCLVNKTLSAV